MLVDGGIVAGQLDRASEFLPGLPVVAPLEADPAESVDVEPVVRIERQRSLDQTLRLLQILLFLGERVPEVVQGGRVLRVQVDRLAHALERTGTIAALV